MTKSEAPITGEEYEELENLHSPLFQLWLKFERAFTRLAIDKFDISDEDAEKIASMMEATDDNQHGTTGAGKSYSYLIRQIKMERIMRGISHQVSTIWAYEGSQRTLGINEIAETYAKIPKGST